jgi:hypothetical protein
MSTVAELISSLAPRYSVPSSLAVALAQRESSLNPNAVGKAGEIGLFQVKPSTAAQFGITNLSDPTENTRAGLSYLQQLYQQYGDWGTALVAYNEGPGNLAAHGAFPSSQDYASSILDAAGIVSASDSGNLAFPEPTSPSDGGFDALDLSSTMGLSWVAVAALALALGFGLMLAFRD